MVPCFSDSRSLTPSTTIMSSTTMLQSHQFLPRNSYTFNPISQINVISIKIRHPNLQFHTRKSTITCARNRSTTKGLFGSQRSRKTLIQFVNFAAANLHYVLPEPFNHVIREFGDGVGGGGGSGGGWKGFRWGGFNGGGGRKRRADKNSQFWVFGFLALLGFCGLILGTDMNVNMKLGLKNDVVLLGAMCLSMFMVLIRNGCVPEWVLGFCSGGVIVGLLANKKDEFKKLVKGCKKMGIARYMKIK